jgi:hypothetical protein
MSHRRIHRVGFLFSFLSFQSGCTVLAVADAGITAAVTTVKIGAKAVSSAVDAVIPDKDKDKK